MCANLSSIQQFIEHFRSQEIDIPTVQPFLFRKILYATALDPIARAAFGKLDSYRTNSLRLIDELTNWNDWLRVSLPQLCLSLEEKKLTQGKLYGAAKVRLRTWSSGAILRLDNSPLFSELESLAQEPAEKDTLTYCRYGDLFYAYRNTLIHEFREPGYGMEISNDGEQPYYHSMSKLDGNESWELVFPVGFFARIYREALAGLEAFLIHHDIDPYTQFEFGSKWRSK